MRQPDDPGRLLDMLIAIRDALEMSAGIDRDEFIEDHMMQLALVKLIEIIGEAATHVSEVTRKGQPDIPWERIVGMRHRLVHDYRRIDYDIVWSVVKDELPRLLTLIEPLVPPDTED
jgi:uncharacterized protein with HEPN domain